MKRGDVFTSLPRTKVGSNHFDLSHDVKMSCNMGQLVPSMAVEVVPGDKFHIQSEILTRFAPMLAPVMHRVNVFQHFYFVPNRILWDGWQDFITNGGPHLDSGFGGPAAPYVTNVKCGTEAKNSVADYLGLPITTTSGDTYPAGLKISALPFAAYQKIYDEYYRDQNLEAPVWDTVGRTGLADGDNSTYYDGILNQLRSRCWEHDYFTSSLPFAQKGPVVSIPLFTGPSTPPAVPVTVTNDVGHGVFRNAGGSTPAAAGNIDAGVSTNITSSGAPSTDLYYDPAGTLGISFSDANNVAGTMNDLRRAMALQEWYERNARGGSRYIENILSHFGVRSSDARLQRPEYICGNMQPVVISEVLQTSQTTTGTGASPQGNMAGHGISAGHGAHCTYRAEEHGWIIGVISIMPKTAYQQGLHRSLVKMDPTDYYWPTFANLGEQEVLQQELILGTTSNPLVGVDNSDTFGYIPRYSEYKYMNNRVAGDFRDNLAYWHMGRIFDPTSPPLLNSTFVASDPTDRIFNVTDPSETHMYMHVLHNLQAIRKMPIYGEPGGFSHPGG